MKWSDTIMLTCRVDVDLIAGLDEEARKEQATRSEIVREALTAFLRMRARKLTPCRDGGDR